MTSCSTPYAQTFNCSFSKLNVFPFNPRNLRERHPSTQLPQRSTTRTVTRRLSSLLPPTYTCASSPSLPLGISTPYHRFDPVAFPLRRAMYGKTAENKRIDIAGRLVGKILCFVDAVVEDADRSAVVNVASLIPPIASDTCFRIQVEIPFGTCSPLLDLMSENIRVSMYCLVNRAVDLCRCSTVSRISSASGRTLRKVRNGR